jgi:hypothetical protein
VTRVPKAKGRRDYGVAARGRAAKARHRGRSSLCATGFFRSGGDCCPYKPHVGAFVGEDVSDMFDIAYRDMFDTVPVASFDFHVGGSIVGQMVFGLAPRSAGGMKKPLVKVRLASGFSYVGHQGSVDGAGLVDEPVGRAG